MPGHVGIYIGDGYLIDAPHTGAYVEIDSLDGRWFAKNYVGARRIIGVLPHATAPPIPDISPGLGELLSRHLVATGAGTSIDAAIGFGTVTDASPVASRSRPKPPSDQTALTLGATLGALFLVLPGAVLVRRRRRHTVELDQRASA